MNLVYDDSLWKWAADKMEHCPPNPFGNCRAVGLEHQGRIAAVCVYHNFIPQHGRCEISFAADSLKWATLNNIRAFLSVPFEQYGLNAVYTFTAHTNVRALRVNERIGLIQPVLIQDYFGPDLHCVVRRMLKNEYFTRYGMAA